MVVTSKHRTHKVMETAIRELMGAGTPPRFKFKDTYASIEFPSGYTIPAQATLEAKYDELLALEEGIQKTVMEGDLEVGTSNLFVDTETGNVGIGTTSPGEALHIYRNDANPTYMHIVSDTSNRAGIALSEDKTNKNVIIEYDGTGSGVGNYLAFYSGISSWVGKGAGLNYVPANGHVGIGTSSPSYKLDVAGTSNAATYYQNGVELYAQRRWEVDLTGQSTSNFYPVELKAPSYEGSPDLPDMFPVHFKVFGESLGGGSPYNESTLVGYARGGGWSDHKHMYDVHYKRYSGSEKRFEGLYRGTQDYGGGIVIYMRGGYRYSVLTDATEVNTYTSAQTLDNSVFAIKDVDGGDVSGTSTAIGRIVHIAGTGDFEKRFMSGNLQFDGNVGIGTTSPATKLHVEHYGSAIGDFEGIRIANHATNLHATSRPAYEFVVSDINSGTGIGHGKFAIGYRGTTSASRTDRLVIDDSGNVGVGVTDPGGYKLNVNGAILGTTIRGTQLNINGVGGILSGGGNIAANTGVDTGVSLYAGNSGGSIYLMISGQNNSGSQTGTWAYIVRRYHSTTNTWTNSASTVTQLAAMNGMTSPNPGNPTLYLNSSTGRLDFKFPNAAANYKFTAYVI